MTVSWTFLAFDDLGNFENSGAGSGRVPLLESSGDFLLGREVGLMGCGEEDRRGGVPSLSLLKSALFAQQRRGACQVSHGRITPPHSALFAGKSQAPTQAGRKGVMTPSPAISPTSPSPITVLRLGPGKWSSASYSSPLGVPSRAQMGPPPTMAPRQLPLGPSHQQ